MPFLKSAKKFRPWWREASGTAVRNGFRIATFGSNSKDKYSGEFKDDKKHGKGSQSYPDGTLYEGDWAGGNRHGHGVLSKNCGHGIQARIYTGMWKEDYPHGFGLRQYGDGSLYKGQFGRGYRHGPGCMYYPDGMIYMGNWVKGQKTGVGRLIRADTKDYYEGSFYKGVKCGMGKYHHLRTGQIQDGVWVDNMARVTLMSDVKARQTAKEKTPFPIPLLYLDEGAHVFAETANAHYENTKACHA